MSGRVLIVGESDSDAVAKADAMTVKTLGGQCVPVASARETIAAALCAMRVDAIKIGKLRDEAAIDAVAEALAATAGQIPWVVDPVMHAEGGIAALDAAGAHALKAKVILNATVLTPNVPEAEALTGLRIASAEDMERAAHMLLTLGPKAVLLKGRRLASGRADDLLLDEEGAEWFRGPSPGSTPSQGARGALASGIATGLAQGKSVRAAVIMAREFIAMASIPAS